MKGGMRERGWEQADFMGLSLWFLSGALCF